MGTHLLGIEPLQSFHDFSHHGPISIKEGGWNRGWTAELDIGSGDGIALVLKSHDENLKAPIREVPGKKILRATFYYVTVPQQLLDFWPTPFGHNRTE
jgi:hypothetical protein